MDARQQQIIQWLENDLGYQDYSIQPASADASFRRYFRLKDNINADSKIIMDAPPDREDSHPFIRVAQSFRQSGLNVPEVYAQNFKQGFFLLSDLGCTDYLSQLNKDNVDSLYKDAMQALLVIQAGQHGALPIYDEALLHQEMKLFSDWFLVKHKQISLSTQQQQLIKATFKFLAASALAQPRVCVHLDYHSRNLMVTREHNPGVLDFQDAVMGPVTYDLVSLLRDCYVAWPENKVTQWLRYFYTRAMDKGLLSAVDFAQFEVWFDLMGLQRHLKAIGIFARLNYRDGKPGYLNDIPLTLSYVEKVVEKYVELKDFGQFIHEISG